MMSEKFPVTQAVRMLRDAKVKYDSYFYDYEEKGGTSHSAAELRVSEHVVIKTIVLEDEKKQPLIVLMHGDMEISTKNLARFMNVKSVSPCAPDTANKHTGYLVGGTSPFGTRKKMTVYAEETIFKLDKVFINGGKRGFLISLDPKEIDRVLKCVKVNVGIQT
jgi:Cys-tRNA(Pro) deacylase